MTISELKNGSWLAALALAATTTSALAQAPGDIVLTSQSDNSIRIIKNPNDPLTRTVETLISFGGVNGGPPPTAGPTRRLAGITLAPDGNWYVSNGPTILFGGAPDSTWSESEILQVNDLFGAPTVSSFRSGPSVQNPIGLVYDANLDGLLWVQNPFGAGGTQEGVFGTQLGNPAVNQFFQETQTPPAPFFQAGAYMAPDPTNPGSYLVSSINGGVDTAGISDDVASTLWRFTPNITTPTASTMTLVKDLSTNTLGAPMPQFRGITSVPGTRDFYITNTSARVDALAPSLSAGVYKVTLDATGAFQSLSLVSDLITNPESIIYNSFTNKLVISDFNEADPTTTQDGIIYQMNLDGTGLEVIAQNTFARGFYIIPTPGSLALLLGAGLLGCLRRRRLA